MTKFYLSKQHIQHLSLHVALTLLLSYTSLAFAQNSEPAISNTDNENTIAEKNTADNSNTGQHSNFDPLNTLLNDPSISGQKVEITDNSGAFPALLIADQRGENRGTIILVHSHGQHLRWPHSSEILRQDLADNGWNTLTLILPQLENSSAKDPTSNTNASDADPQVPEEQPQQSTEEDNTSAQGAGAQASREIHSIRLVAGIQNSDLATLDEHKLQFSQRLSAAITFAESLSAGRTVVLGEGSSALLGAYFALEQSDQIDALVLLNAQNQAVYQTDISSETLIDILPQLSTPTLDVYFNEANHQTHGQRRQHLTRHKDNTHFEQMRLAHPSAEFVQQTGTLSKRIHGWLIRESVRNASPAS